MGNTLVKGSHVETAQKMPEISVYMYSQEAVVGPGTQMLSRIPHLQPYPNKCSVGHALPLPSEACVLALPLPRSSKILDPPPEKSVVTTVGLYEYVFTFGTAVIVTKR